VRISWFISESSRFASDGSSAATIRCDLVRLLNGVPMHL